MFLSKKYSKQQQLTGSIIFILLLLLGSFYLKEIVGYKVIALILLMAVSILAMLFDIVPVLVAAAISAVTWNYFFIPPVFTFHIASAEDTLLFLLYFFIAFVNAVLTFKIRSAENKAREQEEKENTIKLYNTLFNSLSHELRTPISTIIGAVDTLKENKEKISQANQTELLNQVESAGLRLNRQVENLLNMSRLETGLLKPKLDWTDTNELIHSVIQKGFVISTHTLLFEPNETLPLFKYDSGWIEQVLHNLLHNAIQYTPPGTLIKVVASQQTEELQIEVEDNGPGIPGKSSFFIFDKFYRLPHTKAGGSGLGLSIVKGFTEAHKGNVWVENILPHGARFTVQIPAEVSYLNNLKNE